MWTCAAQSCHGAVVPLTYLLHFLLYPLSFTFLLFCFLATLFSLRQFSPSQIQKISPPSPVPLTLPTLPFSPYYGEGTDVTVVLWAKSEGHAKTVVLAGSGDQSLLNESSLHKPANGRPIFKFIVTLNTKRGTVTVRATSKEEAHTRRTPSIPGSCI